MSDNARNQKKAILVFIFLSILLHFLLGFLFYLVPKRGTADLFKPKEETKVVWVKPQIVPPVNPEIADIERPLQEKRPEKSRFAGQYDSSVKQETVAKPKPKPKVIQENPLSGEAKPKLAKRSPPPSEEQPPKAPKEPVPQEEPLKPLEEERPKPTLGDLALKPQDVIKKEPLPKAQDRSLDLRTGPGLEFGRSGAPDLFQHDYYPDYKVGGKTYLNVFKLQDVAYFVKMKRILKMRWNPIPVVRDYYLSNQLTMGKIECVLGVSLDPTGKIAELIVIRSSGFPGYDREALQTIRDSSPFSSPPSDYIKDGQLRMSWTFTVYL